VRARSHEECHLWIPSGNSFRSASFNPSAIHALIRIRPPRGHHGSDAPRHCAIPAACQAAARQATSNRSRNSPVKYHPRRNTFGIAPQVLPLLVVSHKHSALRYASVAPSLSSSKRQH
jgi:hypothetical protein